MPNPTRRQRERVVELLRSAADNAAREVFLPLLTALGDLDSGVGVRWTAFQIYSATYSASFDAWPIHSLPEHERETWALLEAAARIEEGWWFHG